MKTSGAVGGTRLELGAWMFGGLLLSMRGSCGADRVDVGSCGGRGCVLSSARGDGAWRWALSEANDGGQ